MKLPPVHKVHWRAAWRIIPWRQPRINVYGRIADPKDQGVLIKLEQLTNPRVALERAKVGILRAGDRFHADASGYVKAAFAYKSISRFGDGTMPMLYAASNEDTALAERKYHDTVHLLAHRISATYLKHHAFNLELASDYHDLRRLRREFPGACSPSSYTDSQALGMAIWKTGSTGLVYESVRHRSGDCAAVFSPQTILKCRLGPVYEFQWDGKTIVESYRLDPLK